MRQTHTLPDSCRRSSSAPSGALQFKCSLHDPAGQPFSVRVSTCTDCVETRKRTSILPVHSTMSDEKGKVEGGPIILDDPNQGVSFSHQKLLREKLKLKLNSTPWQALIIALVICDALLVCPLPPDDILQWLTAAAMVCVCFF